MVPDSGADSQVSLAVRFHADRDGNVLGIRFYKSAADTGTHVGTLFDSTGTNLAQATFPNDTASGWQDVQFSKPVAIKANTEYYASYNTTVGHEAADPLYSWPTTATPLTGDAGTYCYGNENCFPTGVYQNDNYYVDVDFQATGPPPPPPSPGLHVAGNELENASGQRVVLHGFLRNGPEYACEQGWGFTDGPSGDAEFAPMTSWHANSVFIGVNQDCWLAINGAPAAYSGQNYINFIKSEVGSAEKYGIHPVIGIFNGLPGSDTPNWYGDPDKGMAPMPNNDHMPLLWEELANTFKNDPNVIFRVYEEPHPANNSIGLPAWKCWSQGDMQYSPSSVHAPPTPPTPDSSNQNCSESDYNGTAYKTVGMQSLVNIIRGTGATNVIEIPGVSYANAMACSSTGSPTSCGFLDSADGVRVHDTLSPEQLMADVDNYPDIPQYCTDTTCFNATYAPVAAVMPLDSGEVGVIDNTKPFPKVQAFIDWLDSQHQSYYAAAWDTWSDLISDYNGTPKSGWGTWIHDHLVGSDSSGDPPSSGGSAGLQMPLISRGLPAFSSPGQSQCGGFYQDALNGETNSLLNNTDYTEKGGATCYGYLSTTTYPSWVAYNLSSVPAVQSGSLSRVLSTWLNGANYNYDFAQDNTGDVGAMRDYHIDVACQDLSNKALPTTGWVTKVTVTANTLRSRSDVIDMSDPGGAACNHNYNWIRIYATTGNQWQNFQMKWDLWNGSQSLEDTWMFYGDSVTNVWKPEVQDAWGTEGTFAQQINAWNPSYWPSVENGATGGKTSIQYVTSLTTHDGGLYAGGDSTPWLPKSPAHFMVFALGTNDCNVGGGPSIQTSLGELVDAALSDPTWGANRVVILPHLQASPSMRSGTNNVLEWNGTSFVSKPETGNGLGPACNNDIDQVVRAKQAQYGANRVLAGPDLWAATVVPTSHWGDALHPYGDAQGIGLYNDAWIEWAKTHVYK